MSLLIKNGNIHLEDNTVLKGDLLVEVRKIAKIGKNLKAEAAQTIDAKGLEVYPGLILPMANIGMRGMTALRDKDDTEDRDPINPQLEVRYSFDIRDLAIQHMTRLGITSYGLSQGLTPLIAGRMSLINTVGKNFDDLLIKENFAMKGNFNRAVMDYYAGRRTMPTTHMAMFYLLDKAFTEAKEYMADEKRSTDLQKEALLPLIKGEIPFMVNVHTVMDIEGIIKVCKKHGVRLVLCGAFQTDQCADIILESGAEVMIGELNWLMNFLTYETDMKKLVELYRQGLKFSLLSSGDEGYPPGYDQMLWTAYLLRQAGASPDELMEMMTVNPARAMGVSDQIGSIKEGKQADLMICSGNLLDKYTNKVEYTIVAGKLSYQREEK